MRFAQHLAVLHPPVGAGGAFQGEGDAGEDSPARRIGGDGLFAKKRLSLFTATALEKCGEGRGGFEGGLVKGDERQS